MKKIYKIACGLYPLGLLTILSGIALHIAGHGDNHHAWELRAVIHSVIAVPFTALLACHIRSHWAWFKHTRQNTINRKRLVTTTLTVVSILTAFSGIALLAIQGANTHAGLLHYKTGIGLALLMLIHGVKRIRIIEKAISVKAH